MGFQAVLIGMILSAFLLYDGVRPIYDIVQAEAWWLPPAMIIFGFIFALLIPKILD